MDFERGLNAAFRGVFETAEIVGCRFHWTQCIQRQLASLGLQNLYNSNLHMQQLITSLWSLAYVPMTDVMRAWTTVIREHLNLVMQYTEKEWHPILQELMRYMSSTWVGEINPRTRTVRPPKYALQQWNLFEAIINERDVTNNHAEGFNHAFSISVPAHAHEWVIIDRFREEEATMHRTLMDAAGGQGGIQDNAGRMVQRASDAQMLREIVRNYYNTPLNLYMNKVATQFDN